jgi:hypothetical protein
LLGENATADSQRDGEMAWDINQLSVDFKQNRAIVNMNKQGTPTAPNDYLNVSVQFPVDDNDQQKEGTAEQALKARAKQILLDAANSL